jgi:cyclohexadieny/prephenate dehydrogenase
LGLIGSSIAHAAIAYGLAGRIVGYDSDAATCRRFEELGLAGECSAESAEVLSKCDMVIIAVPIGAYSDVCSRIAPVLKDGAIISDAGSVKNAAIAYMRDRLPGHVHIVPGHPIAGTEHSGPDAGFAGLFDGRWCILTPQDNCCEEAVATCRSFWEGMGAKIEIMDADHHDLVLGITSHLPHLIAYTIVGTADDLSEDLKSEVIQFSASGFRDFTRIASSDPTMWRDIFLYNKEAVLNILQRFTEDLTALQKAIRRDNGTFLFDTFSRTRDIRHRIIEAGQDAPSTPYGEHALREGHSHKDGDPE